MATEVTNLHLPENKDQENKATSLHSPSRAPFSVFIPFKSVFRSLILVSHPIICLDSMPLVYLVIMHWFTVSSDALYSSLWSNNWCKDEQQTSKVPKHIQPLQFAMYLRNNHLEI
jgi:hypothetical protein